MRKRSVIPSLVNTYGLRPKGNRESENKLISKKLLKLTLKQKKKTSLCTRVAFMSIYCLLSSYINNNLQLIL